MYEVWADRMHQANPRERSAIVGELMRVAGVSKDTAYRLLRRGGWESGRKPRMDRGTSRQDEEAIKVLASCVNESIRKNGKAILPVNVARSILEANGITFAVGDRQLRALMKELRMDVKTQEKATPAQRMRSLHPNQVHQCDPSVATVYYVPGQGQVIMRDDEVYKNKEFPQAKALFKCWRYVLTDHYSGSLCVRYYAGRGETTQNLWDFLLYAWGLKDNELYAFHGLPELLVWDCGSANQSQAITRALKGLRVETKAHLPGNPRAKGQVEGRNDFVEKHFESRLRFEPVDNIDQLNASVERWCAGVNANMIDGLDYRILRLGRYVGTRLQLWQHIKTDQLRELPDAETCRLLLTAEPVTRKLDGFLSFSFDYPRVGRRVYQMDGHTGVEVGMNVRVQPILADAEPLMLVHWDCHGETMATEVKPIEVNTAGFDATAPVWGQQFSRPADTTSQSIGKDLKRLAYGTLDPGRGATPFANFKDGKGLVAHSFIDPQTDIAPRRLVGRSADISVDQVVPHEIIITAVDAVKRIKVRVGWIPDGYLDHLRGEYPDGVPAGDVEGLARDLINPPSQTLKLCKEA